ncbi:MAG: tetratricopeptide repeat protein [Proteobacteria bacterium]|nr:tetratricopeptide repeat protein [Pseudomonadota bacterium]
MSKQETAKTDYVKKETLIWVAVIALVVGFVLGVVLTVYKSKSGLPVASAPPASRQSATPAPQTAEKPGPSVETATRIFELEKQLAQDPKNAETWALLGNLYFDSENFQKAIDAYQKSLALKPDSPDVLTDMGVMYRRSGNPTEAIKNFDKAIAIDPRHEVSRFNKGIVLMHDMNDIAGAVQTWEELIAVNPAAKTPGGQPLAEMVERFKGRQQP